MKNNIYTLCTLAILALTLASCDNGGTQPLPLCESCDADGKDPPVDTLPTVDSTDVTYPIDVPFTELSLVPTASCDWRRSDFNNGVTHFKQDSIYVINSMDELGKYISCKDGNDPNIDFSENSILAVRRFTPSVIGTVEKRLLQVSENVYLLNVEIVLTGLAMPEVWLMMAITRKLDNVELNLTIKENWGL